MALGDDLGQTMVSGRLVRTFIGFQTVDDEPVRDPESGFQFFRWAPDQLLEGVLGPIDKSSFWRLLPDDLAA